MDKNKPTIGPVTEKMLQALKTLETAKQLYFDALVARGGKSYAEQTMESNAEKWGSVAGMLNNEIAYSVEVWAVGGRDQL